jgi:hypothetical protein
MTLIRFPLLLPIARFGYRTNQQHRVEYGQRDCSSGIEWSGTVILAGQGVKGITVIFTPPTK